MKEYSSEAAAFDFAAKIDGMLAGRESTVLANLSTGPLTNGQCASDMLLCAGVFAKLGLKAGDRVLIRSHADAKIIPLFFAMLRTGITPVIADAGATDAECAELSEFCQISAAFADQPFAAPAGVEVVSLSDAFETMAAGAAPAAFGAMPASDTAFLVLTSGTTSAPKAVELTFANLIAQLDIFEEVYGWGEGIRLLNMLPLHHVDGLIRGPLSALWFGGTVYRTRPFSVQAVPDILRSVATDKITHLISVPAMLRIIDRAGSDQPEAFKTPEFKFVLSSADMLDAALWRRFEETFSVSVANAYGLSEVVCDALFAGPAEATRRIGSLGVAVGVTASLLDDDGNEVAAGETGELVISGPTVLRGYYNAPDITADVLKNGAFHTGDYMRMAEDGLFEFVGRKKTAIVSAGNTIHPESATQVLAAMPGVLEAFAFGVPDEAIGERLVAAVVPAPGHTIDEAALAAHCRSLLSPERSPREYRVMDVLPRGASGKVQVEKLKSAAAEEAPAGDEPKGVLEIAAKCFNVPVDSLDAESNPFNTSGWDSLAHLSLIESVEEAHGIEFSPIQIAQIMCLGDLMECLEEAKQAA